MDKRKIIFLVILIAANIVFYLTPFTRSKDVRNFDLRQFDGDHKYGKWVLSEDVGAFEREKNALKGSNVLRKIYKDQEGKNVEFLIVSDNFRGSMHSPTDCLPAQGWVIDKKEIVKYSIDGITVPVNCLLTHYQSGEKVVAELVWYWYAVCNNDFANYIEAVAFNSIQRVLYGKKYYWGLVRLSMRIEGKDSHEENEAMKDFLRSAYPSIKYVKDLEKDDVN
ncbi:exosortase C-terminal domain/associated protein EpsI [Candidatus Auribacterota bacterium]